jgi:hypothetical protein
VDTLSRDPKALGQRVCFIHTGGLYSVFPFRERLSRLLEQGEALPKASRADQRSGWARPNSKGYSV